MRISDWSSDVCSSDLCGGDKREHRGEGQVGGQRLRVRVPGFLCVEDGAQHKGTPQGHCEKRHAAMPPRARLMWMQRTALAICTANVREDRKRTRLNSSH